MLTYAINADEGGGRWEQKSVESQHIFQYWTGRRRGAPSQSMPGVIPSTQNTTWVKNMCHCLSLFVIQHATVSIWVFELETLHLHFSPCLQIAATWFIVVHQDPVFYGHRISLYAFKAKLSYIVPM